MTTKVLQKHPFVVPRQITNAMSVHVISRVDVYMYSFFAADIVMIVLHSSPPKININGGLFLPSLVR